MSEGKSIEERLAYLEEQNEGLKRVGGLAVVLVVILGVALFMVNQSIVKGIDTEAVILSNDGRPRAGFTATSGGHVGMVFYDYAGGLKANLSAPPPLDGLVIYDQAGNPRILIGIDERNVPTLALLGPDGRPIYSAISPEQYRELAKIYGQGMPVNGNPGNAQPAQQRPGTEGGVATPPPTAPGAGVAPAPQSTP